MTDDALCRLTLAEAASRLASREVTAAALTEAHLARIAAHDRDVHSFVTVTADVARETARSVDARRDRGEPLGPLAGIPIALKDVYDTAGIRTTVSSRLCADRVPDEDSTAWRRLAAAGAVLIGKTECSEFCFGRPTLRALVPPALYPWDTTRGTAGSSGGSASALAAGFCLGALGSDTGGSIRIPASFCGLAGLKPTFGRVGRGGVFPLSFSFDTAGPMARSVADLGPMLAALCGPDPADRATAAAAPFVADPDMEVGLAGLRIGVVPSWEEESGADAGVRAAVAAAASTLAGLGAAVRDVAPPSLWDFTACGHTIVLAEAFAIHRPWLTTRLDEYAPSTRQRFMIGALISAGDYVEAQRRRAALAAETESAMAGVDLLLCPATPHVAPRLKPDTGDPFYFLDSPLLTMPANVTGQPALSVLGGFDEAGLPIGLQLVGRAREDALTVRVGSAYERAAGWADRLPLYSDAA